jgi:hypothetical protein
MRRVTIVMKNCLLRRAELGINTKFVASIGITVITGEVARRYFKAQTVASFEYMTRGPQINTYTRRLSLM